MDAGALERVIGAHLGVPVTLAGQPQPLAGGFWAAISAFELSSPSSLPAAWQGRLVLRVMPSQQRGAHETIVQRAVADAGFPTPRVLHHGNDDALGGAFMIMPFVSGTSPMSGLGPRTLLSLPKVLRRLPDQLAGVALQLHAVDPRPIAAALDESGSATGAAGIDVRLGAVESAAAANTGGFDMLLDWLRERRAHDAPLVLVHGDLHPFNLLIDEAGRTMVLDWTNADLLPREAELGFTAGFLRCAPIRVPAFGRPVLARLTKWLADRFVAGYQRQVSVDTALVEWFEALQYARCLAEVASARCGLSHVVHAEHPFETSAAAMTARLAAITGVTVALPVRGAV